MHWGELLSNVRGIIVYSLSPYEQKAFAGAISKGVPNMIRRFSGSIVPMIPPFIFGYMVYDWTTSKHEQMMRKDPKEFANDK